MGRKQLWILVGGLVFLNCLTVAFFLTKEQSYFHNDVMATVGKEEISRQDLLKELEKRYGEDILKELVDYQVVESLAEKYDVKVSKIDIDRELLTFKTMYGSLGNLDDKELRNQIKNDLLLKEMLTKDVIIPEDELRNFFEQNQDQYSIPASYHISQIVLKTKSEAETTIKELEDGSNFSTLAMEKSIDGYSANQGGDVGYIRKEDKQFSQEYFDAATQLKPGEYSEPFQTEEGYCIIKLHEKIPQKDYSFKEVKNEIRRHIALDQMEGTISASTFWDEAKVNWSYE